jgi:Protein of unknown function (DUF2442)
MKEPHDMDAAFKAGELMLTHGPRAKAVHYDRETGRLTIDLYDDCTFILPAARLQGLAEATDAARSEVEISGNGYGLHWPQCDVDFTVRGIVDGVLGTRAWIAKQFASSGGRVRSTAKAKAAQQNGKKGGRPRKVA